MNKIQPKDNTETEMKKDVDEYVALEKKVTKDFIQGLIKLGEVCKRHRDKWKPKYKYLEYLAETERSATTTNKMIRIYEYSLKHMAQLLDANITGWRKVHMFLSLPDDLKDKIADKVGGEDVSTAEFQEAVTDIKEEEVDDLVIGSPIQATEQELEELVQGSMMDDVDYMAQQMVKELDANTQLDPFGKESITMATALLYVEKAMKDITKENFKLLSNSEKKFWKKMFIGQMDRFNSLIK